jgi:hypothetical protein
MAMPSGVCCHHVFQISPFLTIHSYVHVEFQADRQNKPKKGADSIAAAQKVLESTQFGNCWPVLVSFKRGHAILKKDFLYAREEKQHTSLTFVVY